MKTIKLSMIVVMSILLSNCSNKKESEENENPVLAKVTVETEKSLFERLGGEEGISMIVDDIVQSHLDNPEISHVFTPLTKDPEKFESFKTHVKQFLSSGTGGGAEYMGKDLPTAHKGLNTSEKEFLAAIDDILGVLAKHNIDEETQKDMLFILYSLKGAVIGL